MTPRERVVTALNHEEPDRVPLFLGAAAVHGLQPNMSLENVLAMYDEVLQIGRYPICV